MPPIRKKCAYEDRRYGCPECSRRYNGPSDLARHFRTHTGERPYVCPECERAFSLKENLLKHRQRVHEGARPFVCPTCAKTFGYRNVMKEHMLIHTETKPYQCRECGERFRQSTNCRNHEKRHTFAYSCDPCKLQFETAGKLEKHNVVHDFLREHSCEVCGWRFASQMKLRQHVLSHVDARPYHCKICSKTFRKAPHLKRHMAVQHTGAVEKKFKCMQCFKRFAHQLKLRDHERSHYRRRPHGCNWCHMRFYHKEDCEDHMTNTHQTEQAAVKEKVLKTTSEPSNNASSDRVLTLKAPYRGNDIDSDVKSIIRKQIAGGRFPTAKRLGASKHWKKLVQDLVRAEPVKVRNKKKAQLKGKRIKRVNAARNGVKCVGEVEKIGGSNPDDAVNDVNGVVVKKEVVDYICKECGLCCADLRN